MRHFKTVALFSALVAGSAFAVDSIPAGFGSATSSVTATGTYASAVSFTLPSATLAIPTKQVRPGATFTVTIPVTNTTGRSITITPGLVTGLGDNITVTNPAPKVILANTAGNLVYEVAFEDDDVSFSSLTGEVNLVFPMTGADTAEAEENLTVTEGN